MSLIGLTKSKAQAPSQVEEQAPSPITPFDPARQVTPEPTRPLYRIGDRNPSDLYKVIDLSG